MMCRLYAQFSSHRERVSCELISAQNSLISQSVEDERGLSNPHGWGMGYLEDGQLRCRRQVGPASEDKGFRDEAKKIETTAVVAHVRRATVGEPRHENTHPFLFDNSMLAHNGHLSAFYEIRSKMRGAMTRKHRSALLGKTDSEHTFQMLLSQMDRHPEADPEQALRDVIDRIRTWNKAEDPDGEVALNLLWMFDGKLMASRLNRGLHYIERQAPHTCEVCGTNHVVDSVNGDYYCLEIASEPITQEDWTAVPEGSIVSVSMDQKCSMIPLTAP